jgi:hypothetical protein
MHLLIYISACAVMVYIIVRLCIRGWWNDKRKHDLELLSDINKDEE